MSKKNLIEFSLNFHTFFTTLQLIDQSISCVKMFELKQTHMNDRFDIVVVGSGPAGIHAAYPLIKAGLKVSIIDGGLDSKRKDKKLNNFLYSSFRETSNAYDLIKKSSFCFNRTYQLLKIKSDIEVIQSLAKGGLSEQWHGICDFFSDEELKKIGLPTKEIQEEYKEIAKIINLKSDTNLDFQCKTLLESTKNISPSKIKLYQVPIAFPYRTNSKIEEFKKNKNFTYIPNQLVTIVRDKKSHVEIESYSIDKSVQLLTRARYLILAAGSINTTRILLRSLGLYNYKTTFLTKAHYITACIYPKIFLKKKTFKKIDSGQLVISGKSTQDNLSPFFIQLYKFNPIVIDKVLKHIPIPKFAALPLLSAFAPALMIADIRFAALETINKYCRLINDGKEDILEICFQESTKEKQDHENQFKNIVSQLKSLGLFPIRTVKDYTTSHYAGGVPYEQKTGKISVDINGRLHQAKRIFVADSSSWRALPSKPPTLTIMANAARIGKNVLRIFPRK